MHKNFTLLLAAAAMSSPALAQVTVLNGPSMIGSDSANGVAIRVVSTNSGGKTVSIKSEPPVALVCDNKLPKTTCFAYVKPGERISFSLRRRDSPRLAPGQGTPPAFNQWLFDCAGTIGPDCVVSMTQTRTVMVDWGL